MIRKMLVIAAAVAMPASMLAVGAIGGGVASAGTPLPSPTLTCSASGTVTFAAPDGITANGTVGKAKTSTTNTSETTFAGPNCGTGGSTPAKAITSKATKCTAANEPYQGCVVKEYDYGSAGSFAGTGASALGKALKSVALTVNDLAFKGTTKTTSAIEPGGVCGSDVGFQLNGTVKPPKGYTYKTFSLAVCLAADTGANTSGDFFTDLAAELNGNATIQIQTANIDPSDSVLTIS